MRTENSWLSILCLATVALTATACKKQETQLELSLPPTATLMMACEDGDASACARLGVDAPKTQEHALLRLEKWLDLKGCLLGHGGSCTSLGNKVRDGVIEAPEEWSSKALFTRGCDQGSGGSCNNLGVLYMEDDKGTLRSNALHERACDLGEAKGCITLAVSILRGDVRPSDPARATAIMHRGCDLGSGAACWNLVSRYRETEPYLAVSFLDRSCMLGDPDACAALGAR